MTVDIRRELRLLGLVAAILAAYGVVVTGYAAANGQLALIDAGIAGIILMIWAIALGFVFAAYMIDLLVRRRPARPFAVMAAELRAELLRPDRLVARAAVVLGFMGMILFFTPFKVMIGHTRGFPYDAALAALDRAAFGGVDPWRLTHTLFGGAGGTFLLHAVYSLWFGVTWLAIIYTVLRPEKQRLRAQFLLAFLLSWIVVGSFAAYFLASAGPCYYERAFGDPQFRPLMDRLQAIDLQLKAWAPGLGVQALQVQDMLWNAFSARRELFGGGISAMPSMHVSVAVVLACAGWRLGRLAGGLLTLFAVLIWVGSVHLGWHYALDGVVALGLTLPIWRLSGWLVERVVLRDAALAPALAESLPG